MRYDSLTAWLASVRPTPPKGPIAIILAEDPVEVDTTIRHHLMSGFSDVLLLAPDEIDIPQAVQDRIVRIRHDVHAEGTLVTAINQMIDALPGIWMYYCYNAEYLFFPFCETRTVRDLIAFHAEERRDAMLTYVIDLYAADLDRFPNAVGLEQAQLDRSGYYALARNDPDNNWHPKERQLDFFGGLRWRFEEHIPWTRRKIDRISLFKSKRGLTLRPDFTFSDEEYNTYACPWHNNLTAAVCSFRTAKALKTNPGSRWGIQTFQWRNSTEFRWHSQQLMDLGLMEPGQWF
ncbi:MAG: hypothetical protein RL216_1428 [Pseudomonadota bacterium]|jgi:hypothetical protein